MSAGDIPQPLPADPTRPCPIAAIPDDVWFHISDHLVQSHVADFVVCTARTVQQDVKQPLSSIDKDHDFVLRGVPVNGQLYITDVPQEEGAHLGETHLHPSRGDFAVDDNGPWYSLLHRSNGGEVDFDSTAMCPDLDAPRHRFYREGTADRVLLRCSEDELRVVDERHSTVEMDITGAEAYGQHTNMIDRLRQRAERVKDDDRVQYLRIPEASTRAQSGQLTILALCHAMKIKAKLQIVGKMPMMTRLDVHNPDDNLKNMTTPFNLRGQMRYSLGKWLCIVPSRWIAAQQVGHVPGGPGFPRRDGILDKTSFCSMGPMMVYAFFCCANRFICLHSEDRTRELLARARSDAGFREEFALNGPHVCPAEEGASLAVSKFTASTDGFGSDPTLELFGGFAGIL